jgi:outer membrane immunogenic protein
MKKYLLTVAAILIATPAFAQDSGAQDDAGTFTGVRGEVHAGYDNVFAKVIATDSNGTSVASGSKGGVSYGGEVGYDLAIGQQITVGAYAGLEGSSVKDCTEVFGSDEACLKAGRSITAGARLGFKVTQPLLMYIKGGYSNARLNVTYANGGANDFRLGRDFDGFHVGAGFEYAVNKHVYGKLDYTFTQYDNFDYAAGGDSFSANVQRSQVTAGVGFRF